jgi:uncharacterized repeat protein (TIGR03803 family)
MKHIFHRHFFVLALLASIKMIHAGVVFTSLAFFTYTNPPNYGWNFESPGHISALVEGNDGNFYGTTYEGGANYLPIGSLDQYDTYGYGTVFMVTPNGTFTSLYSFGSANDSHENPGGDGRGPVGNLIKGADGNIYGTTYYDGNNLSAPDASDGTIFEIATGGGLTTLYTFGHNLIYNTNADINSWTTVDGGNPTAGLVQGSDGYFYGTTSNDGLGGGGTVFQFIPGSGLSTLYSFPDGNSPYWYTNGSMPLSELTEGPDGNFYGTTYWGGTNVNGTIFRTTPGGTFTTMYSFGIPGYFGVIGADPSAPLLLGKDGNFYGVASCSGNSANGSGIIFQFTTNGVFTILHQFFFAGTTSSLIQGSDGNFYGTTSAGGSYDPPSGGGTVFQMTTNGTVTTLYSFSGPDGAGPEGALVQSTDGSFYGTTPLGGPLGYGTVFKITIPPSFQAIAPTNGGVSLTWSIMPGETYQLQYCTNLTSPNWTGLGSSLTASNTTVSVSDAIGSDPQRFYRLMLTQ